MQWIPYLVGSGDVAVNLISCDQAGKQGGVPALYHYPAVDDCKKQLWLLSEQVVDTRMALGQHSRSVGHYRILIPRAGFQLHMVAETEDERVYAVLADDTGGSFDARAAYMLMHAIQAAPH